MVNSRIHLPTRANRGARLIMSCSRAVKLLKNINSKYFTNIIKVLFGAFIFSGYSNAEGIYQFGTALNQPLISSTNIFIHVPNDGDIIRTHLCRNGANDIVEANIWSVTTNVDGLVEKDVLLSSISSSVANIDCSHDFTTTLPRTPAVGTIMEYTVATAGIYAIELNPLSAVTYDRWDFSIVSGGTPNADADPKENTGNIFSYRWSIDTTGSGAKSTSTDSDLYVITPGGFANTNYVWLLDFNEFAGSNYEITANATGMREPESGVSTTVAGNRVTPTYPIYVNYPVAANPNAAPLTSPALTDTLIFEDDDGEDNTFSPDADADEDTGDFSFTSDVDGTYALTIDLNNDGLFNSGDRILLGEVGAGILNTVNWDGTDASGSIVPNGEYLVQLMLRVGEFHAVVVDAETSGGGTNDDGSVNEGGTGIDDGLTILQATDSSTIVGTQVYWDDATNLGADSNSPAGAFSSTATSGVHRHTWGDFTGAGIGNASYIDTFVYGNSSTTTVTLIVASNNTSPTLSDSTLNVDENSLNATSVGTVTGADVDGDFLIYSITAGNDSNLFVIDSDSGEIIVNGSLNHEDVDQFILTVQVSDFVNMATATITIDINDINDAPTISGTPAASVAQDVAYLFTPTATDDDGDLVTFIITNQPAWSTFDTATGSISGTPDNGDVGDYTGIVITASSQGSLTDDLDIFTISVTNVNDAPVANDDTTSTDEDTDIVIDVLTNDTDADVGDTLTITGLSSVVNGMAVILNDQVTFTPTANVNGTGSFTYTMSDGVISDNANVTITINSINDLPVISGSPATLVDQDVAYFFIPTASDGDGDTLTFSISGQPSWASFSSVTGALTGTPENSDIGDYTNIIISVSDASATESLEAFTITVANLNDAPVAVDDSGTTDEDVQIIIDVLDNDSDLDAGDTLTITQVTSELNGTAVIENGQVTFVPDDNFNGTASFSYDVSDGIALDSANVTITVNSINDAPVISGTPATSVLQDNVYSFTPTGSDADSDLLTYAIVNQPSWAGFESGTGALTGTPTNSDVGDYAGIEISVSSDGGLSDTLPIFSINVTNTNDAPVAVDDTATTDEDIAITINVLINDTDQDAGDTLVISETNTEVGGTATIVANQVLFTPNAEFSGTGSFNYVISDGTVTDTASVSITVNNINDAPVANDDTATIDEDNEITMNVLMNDTDADDGDTLTILSISGVTDGVAVIDNNRITYTPDEDFNGVETITYTVTDSVLTDTATVTIIVNSINDAPIISGTPATSILEDDTYLFIPTASDADGDSLTFSISNQPGWASFSTTTGELTGTPGNDDVGSYSNIQITVTSGGGLSDSLTLFAITVTNVNDAPVAVNDYITTDEDTTVAINILINDSDLDDDDLTVDSQTATNGSLVLNNDQTLSYTPNANFNGTDTISYTISDGNGGADSADVIVTVTSINDEPIALDDVATIFEGESVTMAVLDNDTDDDNDTLSIITADAANGSVVINANNSLTYTPLMTFVGVENIVYTLQDGNGGQAAATFVVSVNPVAITIRGTPETALLEGEVYSFTPNVQASDNVTYTFSISNQPNWTTFDTLTGSLSGTPERDNVATFSAIEICVDDTFANDCLAIFEIAVTGDLDRDGIGDDVDEDIDGDGMSNDFETANGLDPNDASDASEDADGDGVSNLNEFLAGTDPNSDDNPPTLTQPADVTIDATGLLNEVSIGDASATDFVAGVSADCCDIVNDAPVRFAPGTTEVTWTATDASNNVTTEIQLIKVNPIVSFIGDVMAAEGEQVSVTLMLNGDAPDYPYDVVYSITGGTATDGDDYIWNVATATFTEGTMLDVSFDVIDDNVDEGAETITAEIGVNENRGSQFTVEVTISEDNVAPFVSLIIQQNGNDVTQIQPDLGEVTVIVELNDANSLDIHTYDWSATDNQLSNVSTVEENFIFDPSNLALDLYRIALTVTDSGIPAESAFTIYDLRLVTAASDEDTGLPCNVAPHDANILDQYLAETQMGICIQRSQYSKRSEGEGILLSVNDFANQASLSDDEHTTFGGRFDFNLQSSFAFAGYQGTVVIPLRAAIPSDNLLRVFASGSWKDFDVSGADSVLSTTGELGYCPPPFDVSYVTGLVAGNTCIQISISDGGTNDTDATVNGIIEFTGGVHERVIPPSSPSIPTSRGGGSIPFDLLMLMSLGYMIRVYRRI